MQNLATYKPQETSLNSRICHTLTLAVFERLGGRIGFVLLVFLVAKIRTKVSLLVLKKRITQNRSKHRELALSLHSRLVCVRHQRRVAYKQPLGGIFGLIGRVRKHSTRLAIIPHEFCGSVFRGNISKLLLESVTPYTQRKIKIFVTNSTKDPSNSIKPIRDYVFTSDYLRDREDKMLVIALAPLHCMYIFND